MKIISKTYKAILGSYDDYSKYFKILNGEIFKIFK
jgi:hypothetical protein